MLQGLLDANSPYRIAGETHYFDDLRTRLGSRATLPIGDATDVRRTLEDYFCALTHRPFGHFGDPEKGWLSRSDLTREAMELGDRPDDYFVAFCIANMRRLGGSAWGEKTPRHAFRIHDLLAAIPNSRAIFMLRDPRAVAASYRDWKNQGGFDFSSDPEHEAALEEDHRRARRSYHPAIIALLWRAAFRAALSAQRTFGVDRVRIQSFDQLCATPELELESLFSWLGLDKPAVVDVPMRNSSYESFDAAGGINANVAERWRTKLRPAEIRIIEACCIEDLELAGYRRVGPKSGRARRTLTLLGATPAMCRAALANKRRLGNPFSYIGRRLRFLVSHGRR
jgi:hypothetical protein